MTEDSAPYTVTPVARAYEPPTEEKKAYLAALAAAQGEFQPIVRDQTARIKSRADSGMAGGTYEFKYADLAEIIDKTRPACAKNGISWRSRMVPHETAGTIWLQSIVAHAQGYEDVSEIAVVIAGELKLFGGQLTYLTRYMLRLQLGIASEDDTTEKDGSDTGGDTGTQNIAGAAAAPATTRRTPQPKAKAPAPGTLRGELAGAPAEPPPDAGMATSDAALAEVAGQPPADAQADTKPISSGQAKWISGKLSAYYTPDETAAWLKERGIDSVEHVPASRFEALRAELVAL